MIHAVKKLEYTVLAVKDEAVGGKDSGVTNRVIQDKTKAIDFKKLHDRAPHGIGANVNWWHIVEKFNCLLTAKVAEDLGIDPKSVNDSFAMDKISRDIDLGKNPTSNSNMLKTLQLVINAMVGEEYKCTSHDLKYIMHTFGKKSRKALTVTASNHKQLRTIMAEICHKIIMGKVYDLDYKKIK